MAQDAVARAVVGVLVEVESSFVFFRPEEYGTITGSLWIGSTKRYTVYIRFMGQSDAV